MEFLKKNISNILLIAFVVLLLIPQTRMPLQVGLQRLFSWSPSEIEAENQTSLSDYHWKLTRDSETYTLKQSEGRVTIINVWATWCPPCVAEMPSLQNLYDAYGDIVDFYFVSSEEEAVIQRFMEAKEYRFPVYRPLESPPTALASQSIPKTWVLSKSGAIVIEKTGAAQWDSESVFRLLDRLLAEE
ncbi:TlpA family protein disulfide reductase [Altibacter sp. HG106]|uniref:TlpA family protein disulfide reductase n=1 Tax=Altibacter sp. HG106 TaxID=3023937 RepID=UPI00234FCF81|nr:TlpA family protein disulfide reductase [Altibacter sp. HG106]MDC7996286.1 TlpA family protein disulfide reductase [Altibacter sp. HG106]